MKIHTPIIGLFTTAAICLSAYGAELPYKPKGDSKTFPALKAAYVSTSPEDLKDGIEVGTLNVKGTEAAVKAFIADDKAGKYENLDSLLIWKDGKLVFEKTQHKRVPIPTIYD